MAREVLGFEAEWSVPAGADELYREYTARGLTAEAFFQRWHYSNPKPSFSKWVPTLTSPIHSAI